MVLSDWVSDEKPRRVNGVEDSVGSSIEEILWGNHSITIPVLLRYYGATTISLLNVEILWGNHSIRVSVDDCC